MRDAADVLQAIYKRQGRVFADGPSDPSDGSRHIDERDPQRQQAAENEVPSCHVRADNRAIERGSSYDDPSRHGGYEYVPQESVDHRESPPKAVEEGEICVLTYVSELRSKLEELEDYHHGFGDDVNHERGRRHTLEQTVQNHYVERLEDRSKSAYSMLEFERKYHALRDELPSARREFEDLRTRHENLVRDHKNLLGILEKGGQIRPRKKPRSDGTGKADQHKT